MIETISRGAQFKGFVSTIGLVIFPFALITTVFTFIFASAVVGTVALLVSAAAFFLFLDVRGVQFDYEKKLVRRYKQYIRWRWGEWMPLEEFGAVHVVKDTFHIRSSSDGRGGRIATSTISTFDVVLISAYEGGPGVLLSEFEKQSEAVEFMNKYATKLALPARNIYAELQHSAVARRKRRK